MTVGKPAPLGVTHSPDRAAERANVAPQAPYSAAPAKSGINDDAVAVHHGQGATQSANGQTSDAPPHNRFGVNPFPAYAGGIPPGISWARAQDVPEIATAADIKESALAIASTRPAAPGGASVTGRTRESTNEMNKLVWAFSNGTNSEDKEDLLAIAHDLADQKGEDISALLNVALQPAQPVDVQRQALYIATDENIGLVKKVAANPKHPLHTEAEAFLLDTQIRNGTVPPPVDDP
jgi:hypothetical protein